jgi:adenylate cyclase
LLLARHDILTSSEVDRRGGRLIKRLGDGLLAVFPLASDAIETGLSVIARAESIDVGVRAAVHVAEVEEIDDDVLGIGVTITARVLREANGGAPE